MAHCPDILPHTLALIVIGAAVALLAVAILLRWFERSRSE